MELLFSPRPIEATVFVPGSKSITNRALLLAALSRGVSHLSNLLISDDTLACAAALRALGVSVDVDEVRSVACVTGCHGNFPQKKADIFCRDAGTVARFLMAACASNNGIYYFSANAVLTRRPMQPLYRCLQQLGATIVTESSHSFPCKIQGSASLTGGHVIIDSDASSQFMSAILMIAPFLQNPLLLTSQQLRRHSYVTLTCNLMKIFGVEVDRLSPHDYAVLLPQAYQACNYSIEPDLSTASYFFAAAAVTQGKVTVKNIDYQQCLQGDVQFLTALKKMGCEVMTGNHQITVQGPKKLMGIEIDMTDFSDTFMTLAAIAPFAQTKTVIVGIGHTQFQESKRIDTIFESLQKLDVGVEKHSDGLTIYPSTGKKAIVHSHHDHRLAMALSIIGLKIQGIVLKEPQCVKKTFPGFFEEWRRMVLS